jgi:AbiJ N-terminal domain 4
VKNQILGNIWFEVYDAIESIVAFFKDERFDEQVNKALERELAGYRLVAGQFVPMTSPEEISAIEEALEHEEAPGARKHLAAALAFLADRRAPDFRNSIKESISAVESVARFSTGNEKATLDQALKRLESTGRMHPALRSAFSKLYGYTSDEKGIRHAMLDEPNLTVADAKFFLIACSAFVSYVVSNLPTRGATG